MIDNRCMWKKKLKDTFAKQVKVKLDLFHAVKRMLFLKGIFCSTGMQTCFSKSQNMSDFERAKTTPSLAVIIRNLDPFLSKWTEIVNGH